MLLTPKFKQVRFYNVSVNHQSLKNKQAQKEETSLSRKELNTHISKNSQHAVQQHRQLHHQPPKF